MNCPPLDCTGAGAGRSIGAGLVPGIGLNGAGSYRRAAICLASRSARSNLSTYSGGQTCMYLPFTRPHFEQMRGGFMTPSSLPEPSPQPVAD